MRLIQIILVTVLATYLAMGCTAMTDFDEPTDKVDVSEALLAENIAVSLTGNTGEVSLLFSEDLPVEHQEEIFDMIGFEISISVTNQETLVGVEITNQPVTGAPSAPGQYSVNVSDDNRSVSVQFYNEAVSGQALTAGGTYRVIIEVFENDYVETGLYPFLVTVD